MFAVALVLSMVVRHPLFLASAFLGALACYLTTKGANSLRKLGWMVPLLLLVTFGNPLINTMGDTVLFTYFGGRPYTFEALCYGLATASMVASMFLWFGCFNAVLTTDKLSYLFRNIAPAGALVLTMVLRLMPHFQKKIQQFSQARACIGRAAQTTTRKDRIASGSALLSMLTAWALEGSQETADSMQSRGFGLPGRTSYVNYRLTKRDIFLAAGVLSLFGFVVFGLAQGTASMEYIPAIVLPQLGAFGIAAWVGYTALLLLPTFINVSERVRWRVSLSKI